MTKKSVALLIVLLILVIGLFSSWRYYTSPQYSLDRLAEAVEAYDSAGIIKYLELDSILRRTGEQLASLWNDSFVNDLDGCGGLDPAEINTKITDMAAAMSNGTVPIFFEDASYILFSLSPGSFSISETEGDTAVIDAAFFSNNEPVTVRSKMRDAGSYWQITEVVDSTKAVQDILAAYVTGECKRIEAERAAHPDRTVELPGLPGDFQPLVLTYIPAGKFMMGSRPDEPYKKDDETRHKVHITKPFWMSKYEITNGQFEAFTVATQYVTEPQQTGSPTTWIDLKHNPEVEQPWHDLGVVRITWNDAVAFAKWVSESTGETFALPTEAQWEYACRSGSTGMYYFGNSEEQLGDYAWFSPNSNWHTHVVGGRQPNAWGLYDMLGNTWEWCADWYGETYYASSSKEDPMGPQTGDRRVFRGGGWAGNPEHLRAAFRNWSTPDFQNDDVGFRVVLLSLPH